MKGIKQRLKETFASSSASQLAETLREAQESNQSHSKDRYKFIEVEESHPMYGQIMSSNRSTRAQQDTNRLGKTAQVLGCNNPGQRRYQHTVTEKEAPIYTKPSRNVEQNNQSNLLSTVPRTAASRLFTSKSNPRTLIQKCTTQPISTCRSRSKNMLTQTQEASFAPSKIRGNNPIDPRDDQKVFAFKNTAMGLIQKKSQAEIIDSGEKLQNDFKFKSTSQPNLNELIKSRVQKQTKKQTTPLQISNVPRSETPNNTTTSKTKLTASAKNMLEKFLRGQRSLDVIDRNSSQPSQASHSSRGGFSATKQLMGILTFRTASNRKALQAQLATTATGAGQSSGATLSGHIKDLKVVPQNQVTVGRFSAASRGCPSSKTDSQNQRGGSIPSVSTDREGSCPQKFSNSGHQRSLSHTLGNSTKQSRMFSPPNLVLGQTKRSIASSVLEPGQPEMIMQRLKQKLRPGQGGDRMNAPSNTTKNSTSGPLGSFARLADRSNSQTAAGEYLNIKSDTFKPRSFKKQQSMRTPSPLQQQTKPTHTSVSPAPEQQSQWTDATCKFALQPDEPSLFPDLPLLCETTVMELSDSDPLTHYRVLEPIDISRFFCHSTEKGVFDLPDIEGYGDSQLPDHKCDTHGAFTFCHEMQSKKHSAGVTFAGEQSPVRIDGFAVHPPPQLPARASSANKGNDHVTGLGWKQGVDKNLAQVGKLSEQKCSWRINEQLEYGDNGNSPKNGRNPFFGCPDHAFEQRIEFLSGRGSEYQIEAAFSREERQRDSVFAVDSFASEGSFEIGRTKSPIPNYRPETNYFEAFIQRNSSEKSANVLNSSKDISRFSSIAEEPVESPGDDQNRRLELAIDEPDLLSPTDPAYFLQFLRYCDERLLMRDLEPCKVAVGLDYTSWINKTSVASKVGRHRPKQRREDPAIHLDVCSNMVTKGFYLHNTHPDMTQIDDNDDFVTLDDNRDLKSMFGLKSQDFGKIPLKDIDKDFDDRESFLGNKEQSVAGLKPPKSHRTLYGAKKSVNGDDLGMDLSPRMTVNQGSRNTNRDNRRKLYQSGLAIQQNTECELHDYQKLNSEKVNQKHKRHFKPAAEHFPPKMDLPDYEEGLGIQSHPPPVLINAFPSTPASTSSFSQATRTNPNPPARKPPTPPTTQPTPPEPPTPPQNRPSVPDTFCLSSATKQQSAGAGLCRPSPLSPSEGFAPGSQLHFDLDSECKPPVAVAVVGGVNVVAADGVRGVLQPTSDFGLCVAGGAARTVQGIRGPAGGLIRAGSCQKDQRAVGPEKLAAGSGSAGPHHCGLADRFLAVGRINASLESAEGVHEGRVLHFDSQSFVYRSEEDVSRRVSTSQEYRNSLRASDVGLNYGEQINRTKSPNLQECDRLNELAPTFVPMSCSLGSNPTIKCKLPQNTHGAFKKDNPIQNVTRSKKSSRTSRSDIGEAGLPNSIMDAWKSSTESVVPSISRSPQAKGPTIQVPKLIGLSRLMGAHKLQISSTSRISKEYFPSNMSARSPIQSGRQMSFMIPNPSGKTESAVPGLVDDSAQLGSPRLGHLPINVPAAKAIHHETTSYISQRNQRPGHREQQDSPYDLHETGRLPMWDANLPIKAQKCRQSLILLNNDQQIVTMMNEVQSKQRQFE